jgi:hypothetical protein
MTTALVKYPEQRDVARVLMKNGRATGVVLRNGDEIAGAGRGGGDEPENRAQQLVDPMDLPPSFAGRLRNVRRGVTAKINVASKRLRLPRSAGCSSAGAAC